MSWLADWRESRRIRFLLKLHRETLAATGSHDEARLAVLLDLRMRAGRLGDQLACWPRTIWNQEISTLFSPLEVLSYDALKAVAFVVSWENPSRYNEPLSMAAIRSGTTALDQLTRRVSMISAKEASSTKQGDLGTGHLTN